MKSRSSSGPVSSSAPHRNGLRRLVSAPHGSRQMAAPSKTIARLPRSGSWHALQRTQISSPICVPTFTGWIFRPGSNVSAILSPASVMNMLGSFFLSSTPNSG